MDENDREIPGYRISEGEKKCSNCAAFENGFCYMFQQDVRPYYVCNDWVDDEEWEKKQIKNIQQETEYHFHNHQRNKKNLSKIRKALFEIGSVLESKKGSVVKDKVNNIEWDLETVQTAALSGVYYNADKFFQALKKAIREKDGQEIRDIESTVVEILNDVFSKDQDWSYSVVKIRRHIRNDSLSISDLFLLLQHASAIDRFVENELERKISGELSFVHHSLGEYIDFGFSGDNESLYSIDFIISNLKKDDLFDYFQAEEGFSESDGVLEFDSYPGKKFAQISYTEGPLDDKITTIIQKASQVSDYITDQEIFEVAKNGKYLPDLEESGQDILYEGFWGTVESGTDFVLNNISEDFFKKLSELSRKSFTYYNKFRNIVSGQKVTERDIKEMLEDFGIKYLDYDIDQIIEEIKNDAEVGDDEKLNVLEDQLSSTLKDLHSVDSDYFEINGPQNAGLSRDKITHDNILEILYEIYIGRSILTAFQETSSLAEDLFQSFTELKNDLKKSINNLPIYRVKFNGEYESSEDEEGDIENFEYIATSCIIRPRTELGLVQFIVYIFSGIDENTGKFSYSKQVQKDNKLKFINNKKIKPHKIKQEILF